MLNVGVSVRTGGALSVIEGVSFGLLLSSEALARPRAERTIAARLTKKSKVSTQGLKVQPP